MNLLLFVNFNKQYYLLRYQYFLFILISYINVQKSTDFKPQEKRGGGQIGRKKERKKRADNNNLGKGRDKEKERVGHVQGTGSHNL